MTQQHVKLPIGRTANCFELVNARRVQQSGPEMLAQADVDGNEFEECARSMMLWPSAPAAEAPPNILLSRISGLADVN
jgi:hypothetical protein